MARISRDHLYLFFEHGVEVTTKTIYLQYQIDKDASEEAIKALHVLANIRPEDPITILINSEGGETEHGLAIYDTIRNLKCPVHGIVAGSAESIAAWILQACDVRKIHKNAYLMIHDGDGPKTKFTKEQDRVCRDILLHRIQEKVPGYKASDLQRMLDKDTFLWPNEALALGLVDEVLP